MMHWKRKKQPRLPIQLPAWRPPPLRYRSDFGIFRITRKGLTSLQRFKIALCDEPGAFLRHPGHFHEPLAFVATARKFANLGFGTRTTLTSLTTPLSSHKMGGCGMSTGTAQFTTSGVSNPTVAIGSSRSTRARSGLPRPAHCRRADSAGLSESVHGAAVLAGSRRGRPVASD